MHPTEEQYRRNNSLCDSLTIPILPKGRILPVYVVQIINRPHVTGAVCSTSSSVITN